MNYGRILWVWMDGEGVYDGRIYPILFARASFLACEGLAPSFGYLFCVCAYLYSFRGPAK